MPVAPSFLRRPVPPRPSRPRAASTPARSATEGRLIYAVGDIHGSLDLLERLLIEVTVDALASRPDTRPMLIFVGDYIDRGEASAGVLERMLSLRRGGVFEVRNLKGNHEEAMLTFLADASFGPTWVNFGGDATMRSYGVRPPSKADDLSAWVAAQRAFQAAVPARHREFVASLELLIAVGDYVFVHAGIDPDAPLERQTEHELLWSREFLASEPVTGRIVVHGHTPSEHPELRPNRLGIDTGAYETGVLTAVRLADDAVRVIQVQREAGAAPLTARPRQK